MTTNPKPDSPEEEAAPLTEKQRRGKERAARRAARKQAAETPPEGEHFSANQIRNARRVAMRHAIKGESDRDIIQQLRARGIDPFAPSSILHLVVNRDQPEGEAPPVVYVQPSKSNGVSGAIATDEEIMNMRRDIARRRRRSLFFLMMRLMLFVLLPTALAGFYFFRVATPMYATEAEFLVQKSGGAGGSLGSLFSGTALGSSQEAVAVQRYLVSAAAIARLDDEHGYIAHFSQDHIDPLQRLSETASLETAHEHYKRHVKVGYDPTEGVVRTQVIAASAAATVEFADALVSYAEEVVDDLSLRQREDQMRGARESFEAARLAMLDAQKRVLELQQARGVLNAEAEAGTLMSQVQAFDLQLIEERQRLDQLLQNVQPPEAKVRVARSNIARLEATIADIRQQMTGTGTDGGSLAQIAGELVVAEADLQSRQLLLQQALQQMETARTEADRQVGYLALNVAPVMPEDARYPRSLQNTLLAFLVFAGIYLAVSLTASVLREQVSA